MADRIQHITGPDGQGYTDVWVDGMYSRIQGTVAIGHAIQMVRNSRLTYKFRD